MTDNAPVDLSPEDAFARLQVWYGKQQQLAELKTEEVLERKTLAGFYFPTPEEGTNRLPLGGGFDLKLSYSLNRSVDVAALDNVKAGDVKKHKLNMDELFPLKPSLNLTAYRKLTPAQRAFVDTLLEVKEGTPGLKIVPSTSNDDGEEVRAPAAPAPAAPQYDIAPVAEEAAVGQFYTDGEGSWWQLDTDLEWQAIEDEELVATLEAQVAKTEDTPEPPPAPAKKTTRRTRKKKGDE